MSEKSLTGKSMFKITLPVVIGLVLVFVIAIATTAVKTEKANPQISNGNQTYLTVGNDFIITNDKLYKTVRNSYGSLELEYMVDSILYQNISVTDEDVTKLMNMDKYGVESLDEYDGTNAEKEKAEKLFYNNLKLSGLETDSEIKEYYQLQAKREKYAFDTFKNKISEFEKKSEKDTYTDEDYKKYYEENYKATVETIVIPFASAEQAEKMMKANGINPNVTNKKGWVSSAYDENLPESSSNELVKLSPREVKLAFINMYNEMLGYYNDGNDILLENVHYKLSTTTIPGEDGEADTTVDDVEFLEAFSKFESDTNEFSKFTYTLNELGEISSSLETAVKNLDLEDDFYESYTTSTKSYSASGSSIYYLAIKLGEESPVEFISEDDQNADDADYTEEQLEANKQLKAEIKDKILEDALTDNMKNQMLYENRYNSGLVIFDSYLENTYASQYTDFFTNTLKSPSYNPYVKTTETSDSVIAVFYVDGVKKEITSDQLFASLKEKFGVYSSINFITDYSLISNEELNEVYNPYTGEIYDEEAYKKVINDEVSMLKKYFNSNYFSQQGYDSKYGWANFISDFLLADNDKELIMSKNLYYAGIGTAYEGLVKNFTEGSYEYKNDEAANDIYREMKKIYDEFFEVDVLNVLVYVDYENTGSPENNIITGQEAENTHKESNWTAQQKDLAKELSVLFYELAPYEAEADLYSQLNAVLVNYQEATPSDTQFGKYIAAGLKVKVESKQTYSNTSSLVPEFLDEIEVIWNEAASLDLLGVELDAPFISEGFETTFGVHAVAVSKASDRLYIDKELTDESAWMPSEKNIEDYKIIKKADEDKTDEEKELELDPEIIAAIEYYYTPAVKELEGENRIATEMINERANISFTFANAADKAIYDAITLIQLENIELNKQQ